MLRVDTHYLTDCGYTWNEEYTSIYQLYIVVTLFLAPFVIMSVAYYRIAMVLWHTHIPGSSETTTGNTSGSRSIENSTIDLSKEENSYFSADQLDSETIDLKKQNKAIFRRATRMPSKSLMIRFEIIGNGGSVLEIECQKKLMFSANTNSSRA